ncbi:GNAT family N-acetyltransferase [Herbiconiux sp.]|uniref:GNAT family N-acetyltransferase n=1 Tax=Herbiconiux sp. TaxID=1871186 RepID=UPI0025BABABE|nr:GNAT family N-acetyltransferase [Herbiconiux sp.]
MQAGIRSLKPPLPPSEGLLLGMDVDGEIAAVARMSFDLDGQQLLILAVATQADRRNRGYGREALRRSLAVLAATKAEYEMDCAVWARIHRENRPSQRIFGAAGFENLGAVDAGDLEVWVQMFSA